MLLGDTFLILALLFWMSASVGPWWVGLSIFIPYVVLNKLIIRAFQARVKHEQKEFQSKLKDILARNKSAMKKLTENRPTEEE